MIKNMESKDGRQWKKGRREGKMDRAERDGSRGGEESGVRWTELRREKVNGRHFLSFSGNILNTRAI